MPRTASPSQHERTTGPADDDAGLCPSSLEALETSPCELRAGVDVRVLRRREAVLRDNICRALHLSENEPLIRRSFKIADCCQNPLVYADDGGRARVILQTCRDRLCPGCQRRRGKTVTAKVAAAVERFDALRMITLTKRHRGQTLPTMMDEVADAFRKLRQDPVWKAAVVGGVYVYEVTLNPQTREWHAHVHVLADGTFIKQRDLSAAWLRATGDSPIVHVKMIHERSAAARYVAKYVAKPTGLETFSDEEIVEYALAVARRRLFHSFGRHHRTRCPEWEAPPGSKAREHVCSVRDLARAAEAGDNEAAWATAKLVEMMTPAFPGREKVDDEALRRIVVIGKRIYGGVVWKGDPPSYEPVPRAEPPPTLFGGHLL